MNLSRLLLATALASCYHIAQSIDPICIIGAGPAGLTAANRLESGGRQTVIFESQPEVGGKNQAYYDNQFHPLGALLFTNQTYNETLKIINEVGVSAKQYIINETRLQYDIYNGSITPQPSLNTSQIDALPAELARYASFWETEFSPLSSIGYTHGVPQNLSVPAAEWLSTNNYQVLPVLFNIGMVAYGYGDLRETPILYMLQYLTPDILGFFAQRVPGYLIDFHEVFVRYANISVEGPIHLSSPVTGIDRSSAPPSVTYTSPGTAALQTQNCSTLVLAFPPTPAALGAAGLTLTPDEATVFNAIGLTTYFSGAVALADIPARQGYSAASPALDIPPPAVGRPVAFVRLHDDSPVATTWSWANGGDANIMTGTARELLVDTLMRLNKDPSVPGARSAGVVDVDVRAFRGWDYFPHFRPAELAGGWYAKFDALQGQQGTYFASGLNGFETVEFAVRAGIDVAGRILNA